MDLFGAPIPDRALTPRERKRLRGTPKPKGYAWHPGSGPEGETCKSCEHIARIVSGSRRVFRKCALMKAHWTHGPGSDIKASAPACKFWERPTDGP